MQQAMPLRRKRPPPLRLEFHLRRSSRFRPARQVWLSLPRKVPVNSDTRSGAIPASDLP